MSDLYVSASGLDKFTTCPKQYLLSRTLSPKPPISSVLQIGLDVHAIMAGENVVSAYDEVPWYVKRLKEMEKAYTVFLRETTTTVPYIPGVVLNRRTDAMGVHNESGEEVVIDYKTGAWPWTEFTAGGKSTVPKANSFQSAIYLWGDDMPARMDYLVVTSNGGTKVHTVYADGDMFGNLRDAVELLRLAHTARLFPRHEGWLCNSCDFIGPCHDLPGWRANYTERRRE